MENTSESGKIKRKCQRLCWKGTKREHICNKDLYKRGICYYHWKLSYPYEKPKSRKRKI